MDNSKWPAKSVLPLAMPGIKFIVLAIALTVICFMFGWLFFAFLCFCITFFICWFFRDPERVIPKDINSLVSPADGRILNIEKHEKYEYLSEKCTKISIFMSVFNVHVNRVPFDGLVQKVLYIPGKFINASFDKASTHNERNALIIKTRSGIDFAVVQIAGLIARRIVNSVKANDNLKKGARYGMILFGSRLELYLPDDFDVKVDVGEKTLAGSTIIGFFSEKKL